MPLTAEDTLNRLTAKAAKLLNWTRAPADCYDGSQEAWVAEVAGQEVTIGSVRLYSPIEELLHQFKEAQSVTARD